MAAAAQAASTAASIDPLCIALGDFYWEIGDTNGALAGGAQQGGSIAANTSFGIASASKFVFGAYVLQKRHGVLDASLSNGLRFLSGYTSVGQTGDLACAFTLTVGGCFNAADNSVQNAADIGKFFYDGGHDQKLAAIDLGLANYTSAQLAAEYQATLGVSGLGFNIPLIAGGMQASASAYAPFLRKLMTQQLELGKHLGENAVCAQPAVCPNDATSSPVPVEPWSYSYNHWVESETGAAVDAYSSPGAFGFYPWITPDRRYYGIVSRHASAGTAAFDSVQCGRKIRKAFLAAL